MPNPEEVALRTAGQRRINIIWETTQALIALSVVWAFLYACVRIVVRNVGDMGVAFVVLSNIVALVIGFYFGRTNHEKTGGVGVPEDGR